MPHHPREVSGFLLPPVFHLPPLYSFPLSPAEAVAREVLGVHYLGRQPLRFVQAAESFEEASAYLHNTVSGIEAAYCAFGAILETLLPDEQLRKELGLGFLEQKQSFRQ
ncbi:hypothetical protein OPV22_031199 [Ensete ventricosum]|uniref:BRO1 domain-containing protein n=1 Tax=Ensete ventricosum TaxID=4639 RepID=A0AAV8PNM7_ENSVE|nr:hypothetical protein OPV22_031199 [Ensete ventricosum]